MQATHGRGTRKPRAFSPLELMVEREAELRMPSVGSVTLVAQPQVRDPLYARTVLVAARFGNDQHYGFIVNRPTRYKLGDMFPGHAPSQKVIIGTRRDDVRLLTGFVLWRPGELAREIAGRMYASLILTTTAPEARCGSQARRSIYGKLGFPTREIHQKRRAGARGLRMRQQFLSVT